MFFDISIHNGPRRLSSQLPAARAGKYDVNMGALIYLAGLSRRRGED